MKDREKQMNRTDNLEELSDTVSIPNKGKTISVSKFKDIKLTIPYKDSIVLSKEEWECLHNDYAKALYNARKNERKETIDKFVEEFKKYKVKKFSPIGIDQRDMGVSWIEMPEWKFDEFIKQLGVKIKE